MAVVFHLGSGSKVTVPVQNVKSSSYFKDILEYMSSKECSSSSSSEDVVDEYVKPEFDPVFHFYINFLLGHRREIDNINTIMRLFDVEDFYDDKRFLAYLTEQTYKVWDEFLPYLPLFYEDTEVMLRTPYEFLPAKLKTNHDFLYGEGGWVNFNKNTQVILNGNKVYHTILTYYEDSHQWKKLEIYHTIDGEKVSYCYVECWYENGRPRYRKNYKNGREDGLMEYWYEVSTAHASSVPKQLQGWQRRWSVGSLV